MTQQAIADSATGWRVSRLLLAPHRLGFFLGHGLLALSAAWWAWVQLARAGLVSTPAPVLPPTTLHSVLMVFGFLPLYFFGFLFTAGPRWLGVPPPTARAVAAPLLAQAAGWCIWLGGGHLHALAALAGLLLAFGGFAWAAWLFFSLVLASPAEDQLHPRLVATALGIGMACLAGLAVALALESARLQSALVHTALWGMAVAVFVSVVHRMIPFFTSSSLPLADVWTPFWVLWALLAAVVLEIVAGWLEAYGIRHPAWLAVRGGIELLAGAGVVGLAIAWGMVQSMKARLLAMLHLGFGWLGLALLLAGTSHSIEAVTGTVVLPLAALHAVSMGCLGSLLLAMVTRLSCGHGGRPLVVDNLLWTLFCLLQAATLLRVLASLPLSYMQVLLAAAAVLWGVAVTAWALRLGAWYGRVRADGRRG